MAKRVMPKKFELPEDVNGPIPSKEKKVEEPEERKVIVVDCGKLRMHDKPDIASTVVSTIPVNTICIVLEMLPHWVKVCVFNGSQCGYVARKYTKEV